MVIATPTWELPPLAIYSPLGLVEVRTNGYWDCAARWYLLAAVSIVVEDIVEYCTSEQAQEKLAYDTQLWRAE